jgi:cGMP-dependent protein kinase
VKEIYDKNLQIIKGFFIINLENDEAKCLYLIREGEVECIKNNQIIGRLIKDEIFGELKNLCFSNWSMDIITRESIVVYSISWEIIKEILGENFKDYLISNILKQTFPLSKYLNGINFTKTGNKFNKFKARHFEKEEKIISKGELMCSKIIILILGKIIDVFIKLNKSKSYEIIADKGQILFEKEVYHNIKEEIENDLIAGTDCYILECKKEDLFSIDESFENNNLILSLRKIPLFCSLTSQKLEYLSKSVQTVTFKDGEVIFFQGENSYNLYVVVSGRINIYIDKNYVRTLNPNEYFGERAMFFNEPRTATAKSHGTVTCYSLSKDEFKKVIHNGLKDHLIKRYFLQDDKVQLKDLDYVKDLDKRKYGFVSLVINRNTGFPYAMKIIS